MKTRTTSNWRALLRAFYPCLIASAVLWAMPRNAHAQQLYVASRPQGGGVVGEYNATTGGAIDTDFITGLSNLGNMGLAVDDDILFVSDSSGFVGKYDATTGAAISPSFITGLNFPFGLAVLSNTLFVANFKSGTVGKYNATTGAAIKADFITGLEVPFALAVSGNTLFVATREKVGAYDATTGATINADFITGLRRPFGLAVLNDRLFVAEAGNNKVGAYNATTGKAINADFILGLDRPAGLAVLRGAEFAPSTLFVAETGSQFGIGKVGAYNATTGKAINPNFITKLNDLFAIAVKK